MPQVGRRSEAVLADLVDVEGKLGAHMCMRALVIRDAWTKAPGEPGKLDPYRRIDGFTVTL